MIERHDGPTPRGGSYTITVWRDAEGDECDREAAAGGQVSEYAADGKWLGETVFTLDGPS
jgi:hypothetical protein